jgi:hypothetical protein
MGDAMNLSVGDITEHLESIGQLIIALGSLGLFGKIWQGVGLLKNIELEVRSIQTRISTVDFRITTVDKFMSESQRDREGLHIAVEALERRIDTLEDREG